MYRRFSTIPLLVLCFAARAVAEEAPLQNPNDAVFAATQIVIVSPGEPPAFKIERSYRGKLAVGSKIDLPGFKLETWEDSDEPLPVGMNEETRILMFLCPGKENPAALEIVDDWSYFFRGVEQIDQLDATAKRAMAIHREWKDARDRRDPRARVVALFPYLLGSQFDDDDAQQAQPGFRCRELTMQELAKLKPTAGDYLASKLATAAPTDGQRLLLDFPQLQSPAAHDAAIAFVDRALARLRAYLADHNLKQLEVREHLRGLPAELHSDYTTIYWGLSAVASFQDPNDLPYFRALVPLLMASNYALPLEACLGAMSQNPVPENVPVLLAIWEGYQPIWADLKARDEWLKNAPAGSAARNVWLTNAPPVGGALAGSIAAHKDPALIPVLLGLLDLPTLDDEAQRGLRQLTGQDFHRAAEWKAWYAAQPQRAEKTGKTAP